MNIHFKSNKLAKTVENLKSIVKHYGIRAKKVNQRIEDLKSSANMEIFQLVSPSCHPLTGDKNGKYAVEISGNHRIIFVLNQYPTPVNDQNEIVYSEVTDIKILDIGEDYH